MTNPTNVLRTEHLPDGTRRQWIAAGAPYTTTDEQQAAVRLAIREMDWRPSHEPLPMSPALLLTELADELGLRMVAGLGTDSQGIRHPDCSCDQPHHPDHWATYSLVGLRCRLRTGWWTLYFLDIGVGAVWLVSDFKNDPLPPGLTVACAKTWHSKCPGIFREDSAPCTCGCHTGEGGELRPS